jgi:luciferase family oxidoreductase group 1
MSNVTKLAMKVERAGYTRIWFTEHHSGVDISCAVPAMLIQMVASATTQLRVGAGGVMLGNHSPIAVAEVYRALASLHPDRIDLGLGRASGAGLRLTSILRDGATVLNHTEFLASVRQIQNLTGERTDLPDIPVIVPVDAPAPQSWVLTNSVDGARSAGTFGARIAFARNWAPDAVEEALTAYREEIAKLDGRRARVILGVSVISAATSAEAQELSRNLGHDPEDAAVARCLFIGEHSLVAEQISDLYSRFEPEEVMVSSDVTDPGHRLEIFEALADHLLEMGT